MRALQIEVTSRCTRRCSICPRSELADRWQNGDLDAAAWHGLRPALERFRHVHLQGWGEPLLHGELRELVRDAHGAACEVGLTTNGDLLSEATDWIITEQVDLVVVSIAGDTTGHARFRDQAQITRVWEAVSGLVRGRGRSNRRPRVKISYLLTADNADELPSAVTAAAGAGADELYVTHLDVTPSTHFARWAAFDDAGLRPGVPDAIKAAAVAARRAGVAFRGPPLESEDMLVCALDPTLTVFVGWDGRVAPCVNLLLPARGPIPRTTGDAVEEITPVVFGNVHTTPLTEILDGPDIARFTAPLRARRAAEARFLGSIVGHGAAMLDRIERADVVREREFAAAPFPQACSGCHKAKGW